MRLWDTTGRPNPLLNSCRVRKWTAWKYLSKISLQITTHCLTKYENITVKYTESIPPLTLLLRCPQKVHHLFSKAPDIRPSPVDEASTAFTQVCRPGELEAIGETPPCHSPIKDIASSSTPIPSRRQIGLQDYFIELFFFTSFITIKKPRI